MGASRTDTTAGEYAGAAYVFTKSGNSWIQRQQLSPLDSAGLSSDYAPIGTRAGSVAVFKRSGGSWVYDL